MMDFRFWPLVNRTHDSKHGAVAGGVREQIGVSVKRLFSLALLLILPSACSDPSQGSSDEGSAGVLELVPSVVIGSWEYTGEDCFGAISDVGFTDAGDIAVLDRLRGYGRVFSRSGEYVYSLGRAGSGPGEFISPDCMASTGNGTVVFERSTGKASLFDGEGTYQGELSSSMRIIPTYATSAGDSLFVGGVSARDPEGGDMAGMYMVVTFDVELDPVDTLYRHYYTMEYRDFTEMLRNTSFSCSFDGDNEGNVFIAPSSCDEYRLMGFDSAGSQFLDLVLERSPVRKSPEEISLEEQRFNSVIRARNTGFTAGYEALEYRYMIPPNGVHADNMGRIWVRNGLSSAHEFDVFDYWGNRLFSVVAAGMDPSETSDVLWWSVDRYGLLCFSVDPLEFPAVYFYPMPEV